MKSQLKRFTVVFGAQRLHKQFTFLFAVAVRLVGGNNFHEGRVEVFYKCQWGTICGYGWNIEVANVVCRQLGYPSATQAWGGAHFGTGSGPIFLRNVHCDGQEQSIDQCDHSGWFSHSCTNHDYDVAVACNVSSSVSGKNDSVLDIFNYVSHLVVDILINVLLFCSARYRYTLFKLRMRLRKVTVACGE